MGNSELFLKGLLAGYLICCILDFFISSLEKWNDKFVQSIKVKIDSRGIRYKIMMYFLNPVIHFASCLLLSCALFALCGIFGVFSENSYLMNMPFEEYVIYCAIVLWLLLVPRLFSLFSDDIKRFIVKISEKRNQN